MEKGFFISVRLMVLKWKKERTGCEKKVDNPAFRRSETAAKKGKILKNGAKGFRILKKETGGGKLLWILSEKLCNFKSYVKILPMESMLKKYGVCLSAEKEELLERFFAFLSQENEKYNLTAVTDREEVYCKHFADSLLVVDKLKSGTLLDVGSGGGMPAIPLAVAREDISFTLLEATGKKCEFLKQAISLLGLKNAVVVNGRAEELAKREMREKFDTVTARAVARLNTLSEYCLPFVKVGGTFVAYKGNAEEEIKEAERAVSLLGGRLKESCAFSLGGAKRTVLFIGKERPTPAQYPRGRGKERKNPL